MQNLIKSPKLLEITNLLHSIEQDIESYHIVHILTSKADIVFKQSYQMKLVSNILLKNLTNEDVKILEMNNNDIIVVINRAKNLYTIKAAIEPIRQIFLNQPCAYYGHNIINPDFYHIYELPFNYTKIKNIILELVENKQEKQRVQNNKFIFSEIKNLDFNNFIKTQTIYGYRSFTNTAQAFYKEIYADLTMIKTYFQLNEIENIDLLHATHHLFQDLINKHFMLFLLKDMRNFHGFVPGVNLSPDIIISSEFQEFAHSYLKNYNNTLVVEIPFYSIHRSTEDYFLAFEVLKNFNFKICIDGLSELDCNMINFDLLSPDFIKLNINFSKISSNNISLSLLKNFISTFDPGKIIMSPILSDQEIAFTKSLNIHLMQGLKLEEISRKKFA
jgi:EAL domain-containing protein (putative c-di-GMP-specific phosphodiesterase class I)